MDLRLNNDLVPVSRLAAERTRPRQCPLGADLKTSLNATPEIRPEVVHRARELIAQADYPPLESIRRIATLLATHLDLGGDF